MRADLIGLGGGQVGVERESRVPLMAGLVAFAGGMVAAGEAAVRPSLLVHVADLDGQPERGGVLGASMAGLADGEEDFAEAVE